MSLKGIADGIAANAICQYGLSALPAILPFAAQRLCNMRNAIATHLEASIWPRDARMDASQGVEPRLAGSEPAVLPIHQEAKSRLPPTGTRTQTSPVTLCVLPLHHRRQTAIASDADIIAHGRA